jgi:hypothetical protein
MKQTEQVTKLWREQFEAKLPELLEQAEVELRDKFVTTSLPELLEKAEEDLRDNFETTSLPELLEKAEEELRDNFEEELQENLDKVDVIEEEAMEAAALAGNPFAEVARNGKYIGDCTREELLEMAEQEREVTP